MRFAALLIAVPFFLVLTAAQAAEPVPLESLAAPLLKAKTYCESGKFGSNTFTSESLTENPYRVCASADGRFKYVDRPGDVSQIVLWSDGRTLHRYVVYNRIYQQHDLDGSDAGYLYDKPRESTPAMHSRVFRTATRSPAGLDLLGSLRGYRVNAVLSDAGSTVYERQDDDRRGSERVRVRDGAIVRHERLYDGFVRSYVEVQARQVDQPLADAELTYDVPLLTRYSLQNNRPVFLGWLFALTALAGTAFWAWRFRRAEHWYDVVGLRRLLWKIFAWAFAVVFALLGFLAFITWGGKGHPPAIVFVIGLAVLAVTGFALIACFLLSSHLAQALTRSTAVKE